MLTLFTWALVGILHVHHAPSHDSRSPFSAVLEAGHAAQLDFVVLTEHVPATARGPLPAAERAGVYTDANGHRLLVLVGAEFGTRDGHLVGIDIPEIVPAAGRSGRQVIEDIHAAGGFAIVPHPFSYGGWRDWDAPFDGMELHNNAAEMRQAFGLLFPWRLLRRAFGLRTVMRDLLDRPTQALQKWEELLQSGRQVAAFSGADAHQNMNLLGWQLDPYVEVFRIVQLHCPDTSLMTEAVWAVLRSGRCWIRYTLYDARASEAREVRFPSGRVELQLDGGRRVLEIRPPHGLVR